MNAPLFNQVETNPPTEAEFDVKRLRESADLPEGTSGKSCDYCGQRFKPRNGTGGKVQRFCSTECRTNFHADARNGKKSGASDTVEAQRANVRPTCSGFPAVTDPAPEKSPESAPKLVSDFDWSKDEDSIVLRQQLAVAVYWNGAGGLTIRQERDWNQEEDAIIAIAPENVSAFVDKLTDVIGIPNAGK